jgi:PAS domain S-box-containing protein
MQEHSALAFISEPSLFVSLLIVALLVLLAAIAVGVVVVGRRRKRIAAQHICEASSHLLLNTLGDPAYLVNAAGMILDMNDSARRVGRPSPGTSLFASLPVNLASSRKAAVEQVIDSGQPMRLEDVYAGAYSDVRMVPIHNLDGVVTQVAVTSRDVTEQRQLEATLTSTIQFLQQILESSRTIAIISTDRAGNVGYWNAGAQEVFGYTSEEAVGKRSMTSLLAGDNALDFSRLMDVMGSVISRRTARADVFSMTHRGGAARLMRLTFSPQLGDDAAVQGLLVIGEDITEQVAARRESEQAGRELRLLAFTLNCAKDAFVLTDLQDRILYVNQAFVDTYGYTEDEVLGHDITILRASGEQFETQRQIRVDAKNGGWAGELLNRRKNGEAFPVELWISEVRNDGGEPVATVTVARDISERKESEARTQASLREKEVLLKEVHHRVKNNLQVITSLLNLQAERSADEHVQVVLRENQARIKSMSLVHEELYQSEELALVNFSDYLRRLTSGLMQAYDKAGKSIAVHYDMDDLCLGIDAAIPCGLIVNELLTNTIDHAFKGRQGGNVKIRFFRQGRKFLLGVTDDGIGLPEAIDVHSTETLGLHLVSTLTEQLKGGLTVTRDQGTSFILEFEEQHKEQP